MDSDNNKRINISLNPESAKQLRLAAIEKYENMRSVSRLIEDLVTDFAIIPPNAAQVKAAQTEHIKKVHLDAGCCSSGFCGVNPEDEIQCQTCGTLFRTMPLPGLRCPICFGQNLKNIEDEYWERIEAILAEAKAIITDEERQEALKKSLEESIATRKKIEEREKLEKKKQREAKKKSLKSRPGTCTPLEYITTRLPSRDKTIL